MAPYQDAIDTANRRLDRLQDARTAMERAALVLRAESDAAEPGSLHHQVEALMFVVRAEHFKAKLAAIDAGARATCKWTELTGQHGSTRFVQ